MSEDHTKYDTYTPQPGEVPDFVVQFHGAVKDVLDEQPNPVVLAALNTLMAWSNRFLHSPWAK